MTKSIDEIKREVKELNGDVLSIYLNTDPTSEAWKIRLKNGLRKTEEYAEQSNPEKVKTYKTISKKVHQMILDHQNTLTNSVVCFATKENIVMNFFQIPVKNDFQFREGPATDQLNDLLKEYPRSGVILLQQNRVTLLTSFLGELIHETHYELDLESENWKEYKGLAYGNVYASGANHRDKFTRRLKENQYRWYKNIVPTIEKYAKNQAWKDIHLAGPAELTSEMRKMLNIKISAETTRNYSGKSAHAILDRTILATS